MKTSNVSSAPAAPSASPAKAPTATGETGTTDFMSLFTQVMEGNAPGTMPTGLPTPALPFEASTGQDDASGDLDESEVAMMLAALTGSPVMPAIPATPAPRNLVDSDLLQAGSRTSELAGVMLDQLATVDALPLQESSSLLPDGSGTFDPCLAQTALDGVRDPRNAQQTDAPVQRHMQSTVGTRAWADELGSQISWMTDRGHQAASLRLSPEHLGPLEIQISIQDDQASVWFGAAHADTRAAIEGALPRLREMLASQGLALSDTGVFKEAPRQQSQFRPERRDSGSEVAGGDEVQAVSVSRLGLVDAYA